MVSASQIRNVALDYANRGDLDNFLIGFSQLEKTLHRDGDAAAVEIGHKVRSLLAVSRAHGWSELKLRAAMRELTNMQPASNCVVLFGQFPADPVNQPAEVAFPASSVSSDTSRAVESWSIQSSQH